MNNTNKLSFHLFRSNHYSNQNLILKWTHVISIMNLPRNQFV